jgi:uncharacterized protein (DUF1330 family)
MSAEDIQARIVKALGRLDPQEPLAMLNMIKLHADAVYEAGADVVPCSGLEAYRRYSRAVTPLLDRIGAKVVLCGIAELLGPQDEWDLVFAVRYPNAEAVAALSQFPEYADIVIHRVAAVLDSRLTLMAFKSVDLAEVPLFT